MTTLLLAEDNEMNRDMLSRRLERAGYDVLIAVDGQEAIEMAIQAVPDLILMDLSMPVVDGWEATERLKSADESGHIPIVALTAHAIKSERERALASGCDQVIVKPFDFKELLEVISSHLDDAGSG